MKKILSFALVLCVILSLCTVFSSCDRMSAKTVEKDPAAALSDASSNSMNAFFSDDAGIGRIVAAALQSGSLAVDFEGDKALLGQDIKINETVYFNRKDQKYVSDTSLTLGKETLNARIFIHDQGIALNSESLLGSNKTLAVNFSTLAENFEASILKDMLFEGGEVDAETLTQIKQTLELLSTEYQKLFSGENEAKMNELSNELYALMNQTITDESLEIADGNIECVVMTYTITNETLKAVWAKTVDKMESTDKLDAESKNAIDEAIASIDESMDINMVEKIYINKRGNKLAKISANGTFTVKNDVNVECDIAMDILFDDNEIKLTVNAEADGTKVNADATLTKEMKKDSVIYKLVLNVGDGKGATVNFANLSYTYNKDNGKFEIKADIYGEGTDRIEFSVGGAITVTRSQAKIEFTTLKVMNATINFKFAITFNKTADMPELPDDAKDITTLTEEEWESVLQDIMTKSKLAGLFDVSVAPDFAPSELPY